MYDMLVVLEAIIMFSTEDINFVYKCRILLLLGFCFISLTKMTRKKKHLKEKVYSELSFRCFYNKINTFQKPP